MSSAAEKAAPGDEASLTRAAPYPTSRLSPRIELVDLAHEIAQADAFLGAIASAKLETIRDQMLALKEQAQRVLEETRVAARLHRARCNFKKVPGKIYHLYRRAGDELYFSMLSPDDWGGAPPHGFEGSFRLEADLTWTPFAAVRDRPDPRELVAAILADGVAIDRIDER